MRRAMQYLPGQHVMKKTVSITQSGLILVSMLLLMLTISGCGQKGDLYIKNPSQHTPTNSNTAKDKFLIDEQPSETLITQPAGSANEGLQVPESQNY